MRRFLIWSALAAVVGLILAGVGYWAYWNFYSRFQPVTLSRNQAEIQQLLDEASWVSDGSGGRPVYVVTYRDSASAQRYERDEIPKLRAGGVETRLILFARSDLEGAQRSTAAERATIAELWLTRDWTLYQRWSATPTRSWTAAGIPQADGDLARSAVVDASRRFEERLTTLLKDAGAPITYPLILWRDQQGFLRACGCADSRSWAYIRDDVNAPDRAEAPAPDQEVSPADLPAQPMPYPDLPAIPPPDGAAPQTPPQTPPLAGQPAPSQPQAGAQSGPRPSAPPRGAPQPKKQDDATFY